MKKAVKVIIKGIVQGIFFRKFVKDEAEKNNIRGYVRNLETGNVEAWLEGNNEDVEKMIDTCKQGPRHAKIDEVIVEDKPFQGLSEFKILHI